MGCTSAPPVAHAIGDPLGFLARRSAPPPCGLSAWLLGASTRSSVGLSLAALEMESVSSCGRVTGRVKAKPPVAAPPPVAGGAADCLVDGWLAAPGVAYDECATRGLERGRDSGTAADKERTAAADI